MKRHIVSFLKSPIGYVANFVATCLCYGPSVIDKLAERPICAICETFCLRDGIQDDMMF